MTVERRAIKSAYSPRCLLGTQMNSEQSHKIHLSLEDQQRLQELRAQKPARNTPKPALAPGAILADRVAETVGSWRFIIIQSVLLAIWIILNMIAYVQHWDPYPFILLNLVLSFQAAYAAPIIMMSQNRQSEIDRRHAQHDYRVNVKAELEIELLHNKIDALREQEILKLIDIIQRLSAHLAPGLIAAIDPQGDGHQTTGSPQPVRSADPAGASASPSAERTTAPWVRAAPW